MARDLARGEERVLVAQAAHGLDFVRFLGFSPDGQRLAFAGIVRDPSTKGASRPTSRLIVADLAESPAVLKVLEESTGGLIFVGWRPGGRDVLFARGPNAKAELWAIPAEGGTARPLGVPAPGIFVNPASLSPDGRSMAYTGGTWKFDLWMLQNALP